ncbi:hypothetical protein Tco_1205309 [Tanacetum coccineum]
MFRYLQRIHKVAVKIAYIRSFEDFEALRLSNHYNQSMLEEKDGIFDVLHMLTRRHMLEAVSHSKNTCSLVSMDARNLVLYMPRDVPIIERILRRSLKKRNITPSKNELPYIGSNVAFEENMISRFNIGIARRTRDSRNIHTTRKEIQSMREAVQRKPS